MQGGLTPSLCITQPNMRLPVWRSGTWLSKDGFQQVLRGQNATATDGDEHRKQSWVCDPALVQPVDCLGQTSPS